MFRNAKVGENVWDFIYGWGTIVEVYDITKFIYPIEVKFDNGKIIFYTLDGKYNDTEIYPRLFWDEIKFEIPEKPLDLESELRKLEVVEFKKDEKNYFLLWENEYGNIEYDFFYQQEFPLMKYFNKESIDNFMNNIKDRKITKEEFFEAYRRVFGGK